jgi:hypothetical protein
MQTTIHFFKMIELEIYVINMIHNYCKNAATCAEENLSIENTISY